MKKIIVLICALCFCCTAFAQGWAEQNAFVVSGDIYDPASGSTSTIGQVFTVAAVGSGMMVNEGVHNPPLSRPTRPMRSAKVTTTADTDSPARAVSTT